MRSKNYCKCGKEKVTPKSEDVEVEACEDGEGKEEA